MFPPGNSERSTQDVSPTVELSPQPGPSHVRDVSEKTEELVVVSIEYFGEDE